MTISRDDAIQLASREATLLDRRVYGQWLDLWAADGLYIIPIDPDETDYAAALNIVYDNATMREARVKRLDSGFSSSSAPPARTVRSLSRFTVQDDPDHGGLSLRAAQMLAEYKYERMRMLPADVTYDLVMQGGALKIRRKIVNLINAQDAQQGIGYLL